MTLSNFMLEMCQPYLGRYKDKNKVNNKPISRLTSNPASLTKQKKYIIKITLRCPPSRVFLTFHSPS
ncbi:hypothetical protein VCRA2121O68_30012 [Vibrio crassostreae]|nr:hypothetical protein VCRA2119O381_1230015 [Vibrio crassostreae]CAK2019128.1 hypothetical protein VCRA2119O45_20303 [Vibrio crassostreae]CAK2054969.1 hypothetical protein VCRA2117O38_360007 [Vibrio crassostreae]CAK2062900.1 hypothetical protein VCRA2117O39_30012 [Vibrio crassostreae]CAK2076505.1 hypothetical protein VCRA2117O40_30037 [Vibrio crassostreae]